jgi:hypothetical protein
VACCVEFDAHSVKGSAQQRRRFMAHTARVDIPLGMSLWPTRHEFQSLARKPDSPSLSLAIPENDPPKLRVGSLSPMLGNTGPARHARAGFLEGDAIETPPPTGRCASGDHSSLAPNSPALWSTSNPRRIGNRRQHKTHHHEFDRKLFG